MEARACGPRGLKARAPVAYNAAGSTIFQEGGCLMAGEIVASNDLVRERAEKLRELFNSNHTLRLFQNDFTPLPKHTAAAFVEASFPGYVRQAMYSKWKPVFKVEDGEWQFSSLDIAFTPTGPSVELAYGWFLFGDSKVKLSCRLPFPALMTIGQSVVVRVDCITWAAVIL